MSDKTRYECRQREIRTKLAELTSVESLNDEQRTEIQTLTKESIDNDTKLNALAVTEPSTTGTTDTLNVLENRCSLGRVVDAIINHRAVDGAENEIQTEYRLESNQIPWALLTPPETRGVTAAPSDVGANQQETLQPVFAGSTMDFLGCLFTDSARRRECLPGARNTLLSVGGPHNDSTEVAETTGTISAVVLSPERIQASFSHRRVDAARFADLDMTLRDKRSAAVSRKKWITRS